MELSSSEIFSILGVLFVIGGAWLNSRISISKLQSEVEFIKEQIKDEKTSNENHFKKIYEKLDNVLERLMDLKR